MSRFFELGSLKDQINVEISFQIIASVSYTHLTLPTIRLV